ncbi:MAG: hypothetical protein R3233_08055 [Xanthomonadales bacterium]|nr:hypothetical protein [Xanthomonadales bacterium]
MTLIRRAALLAAASALFLAACSDDAADGNPLLAHVPADAPYVFANLERTPEPVVEAWVERMQPVMDEMQRGLDLAREEIAAAQASGESSEEDAAMIGILEAVLAELDGKLNRTGLESLGFSLQPWSVYHGLGAFPVVRIELADAQRLRDAVARVEQRAGAALKPMSMDGRNYWRVDLAEGAFGAYVAILDDQLVFALLPQAAEADWLPIALGTQAPQAAFDASRLAAINEERGYSEHGSGFLDLVALANEFTGADRPTARHLAAAGVPMPVTDPACAADLQRIVENIPMVTGGTTELGADVLGIRYDVDLDPQVADALRSVAAPLPPAETGEDRLLSASFGVRISPLRDFLLNQITEASQVPYGCEALAGLNQGIQGALAQLQQPLPPIITSLRGVRISLDDISPGPDAVESARGIVAIQADQPQMFVGMAQMFVPQLMEMNLQPGQPPVVLPGDLTPQVNQPVYAAVGDSALGFAVGADEADRLPAFLDAKADDDGLLLSVSYDVARYSALQQEMMSDVDLTADPEAGDDPDALRRAQAFMDLGRSINEAMAAHAGMAEFEVRVNPRGLQVDHRQTFR